MATTNTYIYATANTMNTTIGSGASGSSTVNMYYTSGVVNSGGGGNGNLYVKGGTWEPLQTTAVFTTAEYRTFMTADERIEYQQQAYEEPRDHAFNPDDRPFTGQCQECYAHNIHRFDPATHLYVIDEEIDWALRLAS